MTEQNETTHGGDIYRNPYVTDYSVNSNPLGVPEAVRKSIQDSAEYIMHYPDVRCDRLRESISDFEGIKKDEILCGNGAAELFFAITMALKPEKAMVTAPAFSEYERALRAAGAKVQYYRLKETDGFLVREDILQEITEDLDMMFLCNPNNPTGETTERALLIQVMERCRECNTVLVLDECFIDFLKEPERYECTEYLKSYPNVIIVKAFTKIFCMPGVRLGYAMCKEKSMREKIRAMLQPWNVSVVAQRAGVAALVDCEEYLRKTRAYICREKDWMTKKITSLGMKVYGSKANYIFVRGEKGLYEKALKNSFLIRDCKNYEGLEDGYYRIAIRSKEENERLIRWLEKL